MLKKIAILSGLLSFFAPIHVLMLLIGAFIALDTLFGRWCAKKIAQKEGKDVRLFVTSKKTRVGFTSKVITYQTAIILLFVIDDYILNDIVSWLFSDFPIDYIITKTMGLILIAIEFDSIDEKYYIVKGVRIKDIIKKHIKSGKKLIQGGKDLKKDLDN